MKNKVVELVSGVIVLALLTSSCNPTPPVGAGGGRVINPKEGGQLSFTGTSSDLDRIKVTIPPAAIRGEVPLSFRVNLVQNPAPVNTIPIGPADTLLTAAGPTVSIVPSTIPTFDKPIQVVIPFDNTLLPPLFDPQDLSVIVTSTDPAGKRSWELIDDVKVDAEAGLVTFQLSHLSEASALAKEGATDLVKHVFFKGVKIAAGAIGGKLGEEIAAGADNAKNFDSFVLGPMRKYIITPDDKALDAAVIKLLEGVRNWAMPNIGLTIKAGKFIIGASEYTVEEMFEAGDVQARETLILGFSKEGILGLFGALAFDPFFNNPTLEVMSNVTVENVGEKFQTEAALKTQWDFWRNRMGFRQRQDEIDKAWPDMLNFWKQKRAAIVIEKLQQALREQAIEAAKKLEERRAALAAAPTTKPPTPNTGKVIYKLQMPPTVNQPVKPTATGVSATINGEGATYSNPDPVLIKVTQNVSWEPPAEIEPGHSYAVTFRSSVAVVKADKYTLHIPQTGFESWQRARDEEIYPSISTNPFFRVVTGFSYGGTNLGPDGIFQYSPDDGKTWQSPFTVAQVWERYYEKGMKQALLPLGLWASHVKTYSPPIATKPLPLTTPSQESFLEFRLRPDFNGSWPDKLVIAITAEATGLSGGGGNSQGTTVFTYQKQ